MWWGRHLEWSKTIGTVTASDAIGRSLFGVVRILMKIVGVARTCDYPFGGQIPKI
jgi:hypothetical protein